MLTRSRKVAALQMVSGPQRDQNLQQAAQLIAEAVAQGVELAVLPENFSHMGMAETDKLALAESQGEGPVQEFLSEQASRHGIWLVGGTLPVRSVDPTRVRAACLVYDAHGQCVARYDKIHLFDVNISETQESYRESDTIEPGDRMVIIDSPFGRMGIAVCYDLRFPEMFRAMATSGMELLVVPAAFTATTGQAHWQLLIRARAVENLCYVIAAGQGGRHANGRETFGESMIVDPWGKVLSCQASGPGVVTAKLDPTQIDSLRRNFPVLSHRRTELWK